MATEVNTLNKYMVTAQGESVRILRLPPQYLYPEDALNLAAYLVVMARIAKPELDFQAVLTAVEAT